MLQGTLQIFGCSHSIHTESAVKNTRKFLICNAALAMILAILPVAAHAQVSEATDIDASTAKVTLKKLPTNVRYVWIIIMENHNWTGNNSGASHGDPDIKGSSLAPYINGTLLHTSAHAERYFNPPGNHPSAPNYIWLEAGTNFGHHSDGLPAEFNITSSMHLVHLLQNAGISWKAYAEQNYHDSAFHDCPLTRSQVDVNHVGVNYFADDTSDFNSQSAYCIAHVRPYSQMATDIADHNVAQFNLITPNLCHDGHENVSPCSDKEPANNTLRSDQWLKDNVPLITGSVEFKKGGILFIVWDEAEDSGIYSDGPIPMFVLSPFAKGGGHGEYTNYIHYDHSSMLKTVEGLFGVKPLLGAAAHSSTNDLRDLFDMTKLR